MPKRAILPVENERVILRLLEMGDLPLTLSWRNQDNIRKWFVHTDIILEKDHYSWFERYKELDNDFVFVILAKDLENAPVGQISLYGIDWHVQTAEYGRLMIGNPAAKGKGYAKAATQLILEVGFNELHLREITLEVFEHNETAQKIYKDCGFVYLNRQRDLITMIVKKSDRHE